MCPRRGALVRARRKTPPGISTLIGVGIIVSAVIWLPVLLVVAPPVYGVKSIRKRYEIEKHNIDPPPLPDRSRRKARLGSNHQTPSPSTDGEALPGCGFWKLPLEIREQIWKDILMPTETLYIRRIKTSNRLVEVGARRRPFPYGPKDGPRLAILQVNKRFYLEGSDFLYSRYRYHIFQSNALTSFVRMVPQQHCAEIRHLQFAIWHWALEPGQTEHRPYTWRAKPWQRACTNLQQFTGLRTLKVTLQIGMLTGKYRSQHQWRYNSYIGEVSWASLKEEPFRKKYLTPLLDPLTKMSARDEFIVEYPWDEGICDTWPGATFEMRHVSALEDRRLFYPF